MSKKQTTEEFIKKANLIHKNKYDYSLAKYTGWDKSLKIICPIHGVFEQRACNHLKGYNCKRCSNEIIKNKNSITTKEFIKKAEKIHGNFYDYSLVKYVDSKTKIKIICRKHGVFEQNPRRHLEGRGCRECSIKKQKYTTEEFIKKAEKIHGNLYNYSKVKYINSKTKIKIICRKHGVFEQNPKDHLYKQGCPICKSSKGELQINQYLTENNIEFEREKCFNNLRKYRFDFYLSEKNVIIEFDGIQHFKPIKLWGGEERFKQQKNNDYIKNLYCKDNNINLVRIPYTKIENINEILKGVLNEF